MAYFGVALLIAIIIAALCKHRGLITAVACLAIAALALSCILIDVNVREAMGLAITEGYASADFQKGVLTFRELTDPIRLLILLAAATLSVAIFSLRRLPKSE